MELCEDRGGEVESEYGDGLYGAAWYGVCARGGRVGGVCYIDGGGDASAGADAVGGAQARCGTFSMNDFCL